MYIVTVQLSTLHLPMLM